MAARRSSSRNFSLMARWMVLIEAFCNSVEWRSLSSYVVNYGFLSSSNFMYRHVLLGTFVGRPGTFLGDGVMLGPMARAARRHAQTAVLPRFSLAQISFIVSPAQHRAIT